MFVCTLITKPGARALTHALADSVRSALGGGALAWLAADEAAEFEFDGTAEGGVSDDWKSRAPILRAEGVDTVVQPSTGRRKRILLADMDSTMIRQECIDELAAEAGVGEQVKAITARAMNGELEFEAALRQRVNLLRGLPATIVDTVLRERIQMAAGGATLIATMRANGAYAALVSGGFTQFTETVAARLGFDEHRANVLGVDDGTLSGTVEEPILGRDAKVRALNEIAKRRGLDAGDVLAVGDGANDLGMLHVAGAGVALHAKPAVAEQAALRIDHGNLTAVLYMQGYRRDEFVNAS